MPRKSYTIDEVNLQQCSLVFRRIRNEDDCPDYVTKLLPRNSDLRSDSRANRYGRFNLVRPLYNRETEGRRTFKVRGAKLWNRIPLDMRKKDTAGAFKKALKKYFFSLVLMCRYVFIFLNSNVHITFSYLIVFLNSLCLS